MQQPSPTGFVDVSFIICLMLLLDPFWAVLDRPEGDLSATRVFVEKKCSKIVPFPLLQCRFCSLAVHSIPDDMLEGEAKDKLQVG